MTALDLEAIRRRAEAATPGPVSYDHPLHDLCVGGDHVQKEDPWYTICDENGDRLATVDTRPVAEFLTEAFTDLPALCDEVERLTKDRDHWQANHDEMKARNDVLRDRLDLDAEKVKPRLALLDRYDALKVEVEQLREQTNGDDVECPACEGAGRDGYTGTDADKCQMCNTAGRIDSKRVREMWTAEIARYTRAEVESEEHRSRCRSAAQTLIERIGANGPENVDETAARAAVRIDELREIISYWRNSLADATARHDALVAENAKLREVAERVTQKFEPFREHNVEHGERGWACAICLMRVDDHDANCLYALADLALRPTEPTEIAKPCDSCAKLRATVDGLAWMLAEWVVDVSDKGSGWDDWDENYKDAGSRPGPFREILDKAIEEVRKMRGGELTRSET